MGIIKRLKNTSEIESYKTKSGKLNIEDSGELLKGKYMLLFTLEWSRRMCERP